MYYIHGELMLRRYIVTGIVLLFLLSSIIPIASSNLNNEWIYDEDTGTWSIDFSGELKESFILKYGLIETSKVGVIYSNEYSFPEDSKGYIEASYNRGDSWNMVKEYNESSTNVRDLFLSLTSESLWIRFTVESHSGNGYWRIWNIDLIGDTRGTPPHTDITVTSCLEPWVPLLIEISARDDISGVREIHYMINGQETVKTQDNVRFSLHKSGIYYFSYWAIDNFGNEEVPHILPNPFRIDEERPIVDIKYPEKGLYIFNEKMPISINKTIIIGGFDIEVFAHDNVSGVHRVLFLIDYGVFNLATEEPYNRYCGVKNNGKIKLRVIAVDLAGNTAEDTIEIYYYNFF